MHPAKRHQTVAVPVGRIKVGGGQTIVVQSMTNTDTADAGATAAQIADLYNTGSELVRITVNNKAAAAAVPEIRKRLEDLCLDVPLIGADIVELNPTRDHEDVTAMVAVKLLKEVAARMLGV